MPPYRPLFVLAGLAAVGGGVIWWVPLPLAQRVLVHLHLLLFGLGGAAVAGYLLTALPNWTGRVPVPGGVLWTLVALWLLARLPPLFAASLPHALMLVPGPAFGVLLAGFLCRRVVDARAWSRLPHAGLPLLLGLAEALTLRAWLLGDWTMTTGPSAGAVFALFIVFVGGRAVPAFTDTALELQGLTARTRALPGAQQASIGLLLGALAALPGAAPDRTAGALLMVAGALQLVRLGGWQPHRAWRLRAAAMLQLAWAWLGVGLVLLGAGLWRPQALLPATALHALTMGAMGGMILAFASRAAMRRTERGLQPRPVQQAAALLVLASPCPRLLAPGALPFDAMALAALCWSAGWLLFLAGLWPALRGPAPHPVLSGPRPAAAARR